MKLYLALLLSIVVITSCKKSVYLESVPVALTEVDTLETNGYKFDYVSIVIDGKTYICKDNGGSYTWGHTIANRKIDFIDKGGIHLDKGHPDSLLYFRDYGISNDSTLHMRVLFCKKYAKKDLVKEVIWWYPKNQLDLFKPGLQNFATDWQRENSYDGVGLSLSLKNGDKYETYSTYSQQYPNLSTTISNNSQSGSHFNIVKLAYTKRGDYIEANFKLKIFNPKEESKTIEKGFMRLQVGYFTKQ
jgi:hypothetical protein